TEEQSGGILPDVVPTVVGRESGVGRTPIIGGAVRIFDGEVLVQGVGGVVENGRVGFTERERVGHTLPCEARCEPRHVRRRRLVGRDGRGCYRPGRGFVTTQREPVAAGEDERRREQSD